MEIIMSMQKNYIELLKNIPKRIFSMEKADIVIKDYNRSDRFQDLQAEKYKNNNEWAQEYEVIYNSYVLEK